MTVYADIAFDLDILDRVRALAAQLPDEVERMVKRDIRPFVSQEVDKRLRRNPGKVHYPIQWTSEKQRRAFFATDGFGHGIPYKRTGGLVKSWHVRGDYRQGFGGISVFNDNPAAEYVQGRRQQFFHTKTGWASAPNELQLISFMAQERLEQGYARLVAEQLEG